jgi:hypothetical protein
VLVLRAALLALKDAVGLNSPDWQAGSEPCGSPPWPHLYCTTEGRVYMIDLSSKGLTGSLSDQVDLSKVSFLQAIWMYDNPSLTGAQCVRR